MSTTSQHIGMKIPDGSDSFKRTDFVENYGLIDAYPGFWICTSTTRPTWGASQAGMTIRETDTRRSLMWTGTAFREILTAPPVWWGSLRPNVMVGRGSTSSYVVGTFTVNRPGTLIGLNTVEIAYPSDGYIEGNTRVMIDGAVANWDGSGHGEYFKYDHKNTPHTTNQNAFSDTYPSMGVRNISPGTHTIGFQVAIPTYSTINTQVRITSCRSLVFLANGTDQ